MNLRELIESNLNNLCKKFSHLTKEIPPLAIESVPDKSIIFVGINPSLSNSNRELLKLREKKDADFYSLPKGYINNSVHPYYKKFYEISERLKINFGHIDLLFIRETNQNEVKKLLKSSDGLSFIFEQLQISRKVIDYILENKEPKAFVISNTLSREFIGRYKNNALYDNEVYNPIVKTEIHWVNYFFEWDDTIGTYILNYKDKKIPFFFTSMLTGQRALDKGSLERLIWHLRYAIEKDEFC